MATNHELNQIRADAEEADRVDSERRAEKRGWPVNTADGEVIIAHSFFEGPMKVLETEDGEQYTFSLATREWVSRGHKAVDPEPVATDEDEAEASNKAADPLADDVAKLSEGKKEVK